MKLQSVAFNENIVDGETEQEFILLQNGANIPSYFSALDGDFTSDGVTIDSEFCDSTDITFGGVTADRLDCTLINRNGSLSDFPWGEMSAYIGVVTRDIVYHGETGKIPDDARCGVVFSQYIKFYGMKDGIYKQVYDPETQRTTRTRVYRTTIPIISLVFNCLNTTTYAMALGDGICVTFRVNSNGNVPASSIEEVTPNRHMAQKLISGKSVKFGYYTAAGYWGEDEYRCMEVYENGGDFPYKTYELCTMGVFNVNQPDSLQNETVQLNDVMSIITNFDEDAAAFISTLTFPMTYYGLLTAICTCKGFGVSVDSYLENGTAAEEISTNPFAGDASFTLRQMLSWIVEMFGGTASVYRDYDDEENIIRITSLRLSGIEVHDTMMAEGSFTYKNYHTEVMSWLRVKKTNGDTYDYDINSSYARGQGIYQVNGNPIADVTPWVEHESPMSGYILSGGFQNLTRAISYLDVGYVPYSCTVVNATPTMELGEIADFFTIESSEVPLYDIYGREIPNEYAQEEYISSPVLKQTLHWVGTCIATWSADGNKTREVDTTSQVYSNAFAVKYTNNYVRSAIQGATNAYQATGADSSVSLPVGTITQIPLTATDAIVVNEGFGITNDGGIVVAEAGVYKVSGSVYFYVGSSAGTTRTGVYIMSGSDFSTATELSSTYMSKPSDGSQTGAVGVTPKLVNLDAGDIVYLAGRCAGASGTVIGNNIATWLLIEKI